tara:strand:- start:259 stop:1176 length:918 start_codon:yes stop_codon:yes gene_type:complete
MIILDCDPGLDDAVAIMLLLSVPGIEVAGITTAAGNVELHQTQWNTRGILDRAPRRVPVYAGCPRPLAVPHVHAKHIHGDTGIAGVRFEAVETPLEKEHAVDFLIRTLSSAPERSVTLCFVGPLTNLAVVLVKAPELAQKVERLVLMGGAIGLGNTTPAAEYNIYADPHAARVVFEADFERVVLPLDTTSTVLVDTALAARVAKIGTPGADFLAPLLALPVAHPRFAGKGRPMHDMCAVGYCLWPELFSGRQCNVTIDCSEGPSRGRTIIDYWGNKREPNALVIDQVDIEGFLTRFHDTLAEAAS